MLSENILFKKRTKLSLSVKHQKICKKNLHIGKTHQVIANAVRTFDIKNNYLYENEPWASILEATDSVVLLAYQTR